MKYWQYKPLGWLFGGISRLPFGMLYVLSDILFVLLYHVLVIAGTRLCAGSFSGISPTTSLKL